MELDLLRLFGLHVHSSTHWLRPRIPPSPRIWVHIRRALLVSQDRRHLFVTPPPPCLILFMQLVFGLLDLTVLEAASVAQYPGLERKH